MKKLFLLLAFLATPLFGQVVQSGYVTYVTSAPSGSCSQNNRVRVVMGAGTVYTCQSGTWTQVGGSSGTSVTSFSGDGVLLTNSASTGAVTATLGTTTGTGIFSRQTSPTFITPILGVASGTSLALNASGAYAEAAPLQIQVNGSGVGFLVQNTTSDYTDFISGGALKGMRGTGTTPAIWTNGTNWSTAASIISFGGGNALGTTGTMFGVNIGGNSNAPFLFNPSSGSQKFVALNVGPQIAQTSTASGDYTALQVNVTETGVLGTNKLLADFQVGNTSKFKVDDIGNTTSTLYSTATNCSNAAAPAVCVAAPSGVVAVPTGTNPTLTINTTAVTANSRIFLQIDESATIAATTCNTTLSTLVQPVVTARVANTSFSIQIGAIIATNPACVSYLIFD